MITELIPDLVMVVGAVGLLLYFDSWNTLLVATTFPPMMLVAALFKTLIRRASRNVQESMGKVASRVHETISGIRIVQSFTKEKHEADLFKDAANETLKANLESQKLSSTYSSLIGLIATSGTLITVVLYAPAIVGGSKTFGQMITFLGYLTLLYGPLRGLARFHYLLERGRGAAERIFEVLDSEPEVKEAENAWELPTLRGIVEFRNVTFGYQDAPVLNDLSLRLKPGEKLALVGPSGVGKSTIVNLLLRFYDPWEGMVLVDGYDLTTVKLQSLRSQIGFVPQDCYLFNGTIKENIAYGDPDATEEEIVDAAKVANAHDFVMELPQGYDAIVGERGIKLSLGQRQRIAIARALVRKPRILIFDEATSNLDSLSEDAIKESMEKAFKGRTAFIIAHRLGTVINADKIAVIWDGGIAEVGTHRELLKKGGLYANLYRSQVSGLLKGDGDGGYPVSQ
jgi:subfamily B ATP-binding cassette protein MsbA